MSEKLSLGPLRADLNADDDKFGIFPDTGKMTFGIAWMSEYYKRDIVAAYAGLFAAAPDLLAFAESLADRDDSIGDDARAAIAKATHQ